MTSSPVSMASSDSRSSPTDISADFTAEPHVRVFRLPVDASHTFLIQHVPSGYFELCYTPAAAQDITDRLVRNLDALHQPLKPSTSVSVDDAIIGQVPDSQSFEGADRTIQRPASPGGSSKTGSSNTVPSSSGVAVYA